VRPASISDFRSVSHEAGGPRTNRLPSLLFLPPLFLPLFLSSFLFVSLPVAQPLALPSVLFLFFMIISPERLSFSATGHPSPEISVERPKPLARIFLLRDACEGMCRRGLSAIVKAPDPAACCDGGARDWPANRPTAGNNGSQCSITQKNKSEAAPITWRTWSSAWQGYPRAAFFAVPSLRRSRPPARFNICRRRRDVPPRPVWADPARSFEFNPSSGSIPLR